MEQFKPKLERIKRDILSLSQIISAGEPGFTRISFTEEDRRARQYVAQLMEKEARLAVRIDAGGNLIGRREGKKGKPAILIGSHIDTVRGGGRFDGVSGVMAGVEVARRFEEEGVTNVHPIEVVAFLAEEPSPFGISTIGSRAMSGRLGKALLESLKDDQGRTLGAAIQEMGGNPAKLVEVKRSSGEIRAYFELHIEQGPFLFLKGIPIGVVQGIVGIARGRIKVFGRNDHAGTTPMMTRKDALAAGAEAILAFEGICKRLKGVVGTIGKVELFPNAFNVVPGEMVLGMDVRSIHDMLIDETFSLLRKELDKISKQRRVQFTTETETVSKPVFFREEIVKRIRSVCERLSIPNLAMISGAGHDAMHIAQVAPAGMIFIPSKDGRSHCSEEWSEFEHICLGAEVIASTISEMDKEEEG
jgi:N-carbamoyl-L-amino-acid hydrolase